MERKFDSFILIACILVVCQLVFFAIGLYQIYGSLNDELGIIFVLAAMGIALFEMGMVIGYWLR